MGTVASEVVESVDEVVNVSNQVTEKQFKSNQEMHHINTDKSLILWTKF